MLPEKSKKALVSKQKKVPCTYAKIIIFLVKQRIAPLNSVNLHIFFLHWFLLFLVALHNQKLPLYNNFRQNSKLTKKM